MRWSASAQAFSTWCLNNVPQRDPVCHYVDWSPHRALERAKDMKTGFSDRLRPWLGASTDKRQVPQTLELPCCRPCFQKGHRK